MVYENITIFIPKLLHIKTGLWQSISDSSSSDTDIELYLEQLPYNLNCAYLAVIDMIKSLNSLMQDEEVKILKPKKILLLAHDQRDYIVRHIDNFFGASRRAQNAVIYYISKTLSISLPSSMSKLTKQIKNGKISLPEPQKKILIEYWDQSGQRLKAYRDLIEHHAIVSSDCRVFCDISGKPYIYMTLPNNPETKSARELAYGNPTVHAINYVISSFFALSAMISRTMELLSSSVNNDGMLAFPTVFKNPLTVGKQTGCQIPTESDFLLLLKTFRKNEDAIAKDMQNVV